MELTTQPGDPRTDGELLGAFAGGDAAAYETLVRRHGALVFRTCFRMTGNAADAEDAAQAVFLILLRKAKKLRREGDLGPWLYGVARTVSLQALRENARRARREEVAAMRQDTAAELPEADRAAVLAHVDEGLAALPAGQRQAVLLRYLEGKNQEEAARIAGCPVGTLKQRASRGLERLRERLARRGVVLGLGIIAAALESESQAAVPPTLLPSIISASGASAVVAGGGAGIAAGTKALALAEGGLNAMFWIQMKIAAVVTGAVLAVGGGGFAALQAGRTEKPPGAAVAGKPGEKTVPVEDGKPVNGIRLVLEMDQKEILEGKSWTGRVKAVNVSQRALRYEPAETEILLSREDGNPVELTRRQGAGGGEQFEGAPGNTPPSKQS
ncbi:MAG: RNA polymerase sigma factor, partial [Planctomycetota bacterium]